MLICTVKVSIITVGILHIGKFQSLKDLYEISRPSLRPSEIFWRRGGGGGGEATRRRQLCLSMKVLRRGRLEELILKLFTGEEANFPNKWTSTKTRKFRWKSSYST